MRARLLLSLGLLSACPAPQPVPPEPPVTLSLANDGTFSIERAGAGLSELAASVTVSGLEVPLGAASATKADGDDVLGHYQQTHLERTEGATQLTLELRAYVGFVTARLKATCAGACASSRVEGFTLAGRALTTTAEPTAVLANGYSSWAPSYYASVQRSGPPSADIENIGNNDNHLTTDARVSWWLSALVMRADAGAPKPTVAWGALTAETWKTKVLTWRDDGVQVRLRSGGGGDSLPLTATGVESELLFFTVRGSLEGALSAWAHAVATVTPPPEAPFVPMGWNSWNTLFEGVTHDQVLANADRARALGFPLNDVQVDDGWERAWGDWNANAKFPAGMDGLAAALGTRQLHAGVWLAPFFIDSTTAVAMAHPDWFVHDAQGRPVGFTEFFTGHALWSIDATHPEARAWMVGEVRRLGQQGYRYWKLDFLFAGAWEGKRSADVTSLQAFRLGMRELFAEAQQAGAYVVACGAPVLPSAGVAHALRTGEDIAARGTPYSLTWVKNASRNVAVRSFVSPFLVNDADTILVRGLPVGLQRLQVTTNLLAGRQLGLGDDLVASTAAETELLRAVAKLPSVASAGSAGTGFVPLDAPGTPRATSLSKAEALVDAESYFVPSLWAARGTSEGALVGVLNWSNTEQTFRVTAASLGLTGTESAEELWLGRPVTFAEGGWSVTVPAHDAAYVRVR